MKRMSTGEVILNGFFYVILALLIVICVYPIWYVIVASVSDGTYVNSGALILLAVLFRLFVFPRFTETPHGLQNVVELAVEWLSRYCRANLCRPLGENLAAYLFTVALYMIGCAAVELLGLRAPTSDILTTFAMALVTFFLINFYGIRSKGLGGRLRSMARPTPVIFPIKILTDVAVPVSLACRLFVNMLGGMIVMELLYFALGNAAFGAPAVLGLYFNVFHPLIQVFIFITLSPEIQPFHHLHVLDYENRLTLLCLFINMSGDAPSRE